jgi:hypothetical protein
MGRQTCQIPERSEIQGCEPKGQVRRLHALPHDHRGQMSLLRVLTLCRHFHVSRSMEGTDAVAAPGGPAQESRLDIFRMLVQADVTELQGPLS